MSATLSPDNQALVEFIRVNQPIGPMAIYTYFDGAAGNYSAFKKRLLYLRAGGWLLSTDNASPASRWRVDPTAPLADLPPQARATAKAKLPTGPIVPPRQHDVMKAPVYQPRPVVHRAGALDYAAIPSHVCGEVRPFKGGM